MELQPKYNIQLDYKGYMIEPATYRASPAPLLGSKFATGRPAYSELDFWQIGGITDFSHGMNQKFLVDPARYFYSIGLDMSKPGEFKLERDLQPFAMPSLSRNVTAHYKTLTKLYIGDNDGKIWSSASGASFSFEYDTTEDKVFSFYECEKKLFATTGSGNVYVNSDPDNSTVWTKISNAIKIDGLYKADESFTPTEYKDLFSSFYVTQQIKPTMSSESFYTLRIYLKKQGTPTNNLYIKIYTESTLTPGTPDLDSTPVAEYSLTPGTVSATAGYQEFSTDSSVVFTLNAKVNYFVVAHTIGGDINNCYRWYNVSGPRAQYGNGGELEIDLLQETDPTPTSNSYESEDIASSADVNIQVAQKIVPSVTKDNYYSLSIFAGRTLSPSSYMYVTIESDNSGKPSGNILVTYTFEPTAFDHHFKWIEKKASSTFTLVEGTTYWIRAKCTAAPVAGNFYNWAKDSDYPTYTEGTAATTTDGGTTWVNQTYDFAFKLKTNPEWKANEFENMLMTLKSNTITDLYFVHNESDTLFGWFDDGVRQSIDGFNWIPEPPDPLWVMPSGESQTLNAISIPRGFLSGSQRGLWMFGGGGSGWNIWKFPDYTSSNNFRGMAGWSAYGVFSVEEQGIYFTEGSNVYPTNMTYLEEGFTFKSCSSIYSSGTDMYATVSDNGTDWYLARCNMNFTPKPMYWWLVKKLSKVPVHIAGYDEQKIIVFYSDNTAEYFDKTSNYYVTTGYIETPWLDEGVIKLQKMYKNLSMMYDAFPTGTSSNIGYKTGITSSYTTSSSFAGDGTTEESVYELPNPTLSNRIMIKYTINGKTGDKTVTPVVTDLTWKFILQTPSENTTTDKSYSFMILAEDWIEQNTGEVYELDREIPRNRKELLSDLWVTSAKKQVLNYIDIDNKSEVGMTIEYVGSGSSCILTIDRTNYTISTAVDEVNDKSYDYEGKTITEVAAYFDSLDDYTCTVHADQLATRTAHDMEPRNDLQIKGEAYIMVGDQVKTVLMLNSPGQITRSIEGRGSSRVSVTLRDA
jgi:hypothetical protein